MITSGLIIFLGFVFIFLKIPKKLRHLMIEHTLVLDVIVAFIAYSLHWGTLTGTMAAAVAGILTSLFTSFMVVKTIKVPLAGGWIKYLLNRHGVKITVESK